MKTQFSKYLKYIDIFKMTQSELAEHLVRFFIAKKCKVHFQERSFIFIPGEHKSCLVAHLDTVFTKPPKSIKYTTRRNEPILSSPQGLGADDRAGVVAVLEMYEKMELKPNILLTFDEEKGGIGVKRFVSSELVINVIDNINIFIQFDRANSKDYVTYDYTNDDVSTILEYAGFKDTLGSFSDVAVLSEVTEILGVNISAGYYNNHNKNEILNLYELDKNINTILEVIDELANEPRIAELSYSADKFYLSNRYLYEYDFLDGYEEASSIKIDNKKNTIDFD